LSELEDAAAVPRRQVSEATMLIALDRLDEAEELLLRTVRAA
jgi:hypothetical protein